MSREGMRRMSTQLKYQWYIGHAGKGPCKAFQTTNYVTSKKDLKRKKPRS